MISLEHDTCVCVLAQRILLFELHYLSLGMKNSRHMVE